MPRGGDYDARWEAMAARGDHLHGEADLVDDLLGRPATVLDGGCGTGRVALELARRGHTCTGVDSDPAMLAAARAKPGAVTWIEANLVDVNLSSTFDAVVLAGNVLIFVAPGTEARVIANCARHLKPGGVLVAGFTTGPGRYGVDAVDRDAAAAGLDLIDRLATWQRGDWDARCDYQVSVHRRRDAGR